MPNDNDEKKYEVIDWPTLLIGRPADTFFDVTDWQAQDGHGNKIIAEPLLPLHCGFEACAGERFFECTSSNVHVKSAVQNCFISYRCRNCARTTKTFAIRGLFPEFGNARAAKIGEYPAYGPPVPSRVISLIGPDREIFLKGRRAENQGLGIGAFAYYRRVIENQKSRIISEIGKVALRLGASQSDLNLFSKAAAETQFRTAMDDVKDAIPSVLLIDGHNPLKLLHSALSEGLHAQSDEQCLEIATSIRVVMTELAERISQALKDEAELAQAVTRLLNRKKASVGESTE